MPELRHLLGSAALVVVAAACSVSTEPQVRDAFVLQTVAGDALPTPEYLNGTCGTMLVADTIVLFDNGTGQRRTARDVPSYSGAVDPITCEPAASSPRKRSYSRSDFTYHLDGDAITVEYPCSDMASCAPPPAFAGRVVADGLVLDVSYGGRTPMVYALLARVAE